MYIQIYNSIHITSNLGIKPINPLSYAHEACLSYNVSHLPANTRTRIPTSTIQIISLEAREHIIVRIIIYAAHYMVLELFQTMRRTILIIQQISLHFTGIHENGVMLKFVVDAVTSDEKGRI